MNHLRFSTTACVMFVYTGVCFALFYTNSKENDYPRIGKRPSVFLTRPLRRPQYPAAGSADSTATDLSELYEAYPYLDPLVSIGMLSDTDVADKLQSAETLDVQDAEQLSSRKNVYVMYDETNISRIRQELNNAPIVELAHFGNAMYRDMTLPRFPWKETGREKNAVAWYPVSVLAAKTTTLGAVPAPGTANHLVVHVVT